jgi:hypothetical protein
VVAGPRFEPATESGCDGQKVDEELMPAGSSEAFIAPKDEKSLVW